MKHLRNLSDRNQIVLLAIAPAFLTVGILNLVDYVPQRRGIDLAELVGCAILTAFLFFASLAVMVTLFWLGELAKWFLILAQKRQLK